MTDQKVNPIQLEIVEVELVPGNRKCNLWVGCSDGTPAIPTTKEEKILHRIQFPGGVLFSDLYSQNVNDVPFVNAPLKKGDDGIYFLDESSLKTVLYQAIFFSVVKMIEFKKPEIVYIAGHVPCTAAILLRMSPEAVLQKLNDFAQALVEYLGDDHPVIEVLMQEHCPAGDWHCDHITHTVITPQKGIWAKKKVYAEEAVLVPA